MVSYKLINRLKKKEVETEKPKEFLTCSSDNEIVIFKSETEPLPTHICFVSKGLITAFSTDKEAFRFFKI